MKILFKMLIIGVVILLFGCSKKVETTDSSSIKKDKKLSAENVVKEKEKQPNIVGVPFDFKGIKLGQSAKEVSQTFNFALLIPYKNGYFYSCENSACAKISGMTIVNVIPSYASFDFLKNKTLNKIVIFFNESYFEELRDALKQKYGEPTAFYELPLSNKLTGVESNLNYLTWKSVDGSLLVISNHSSEGSSYIPKGILVIKPSETDNNSESASEKDI